MVVDPASANHFVSGYTSLFSEVYRQSGDKPHEQLLDMLAAARKAGNADPSLISAAATSLAADGRAVPSDVLHAVETMRLKRWVFLRDTTTHSVFIAPDGSEAYAVLGLTDRIRSVAGGSAVVIEAGIVEYRGRYVCDGIVVNPIWLGSNLKKEFNAALSSLKKRGRFHIACEP